MAGLRRTGPQRVSPLAEVFIRKAVVRYFADIADIDFNLCFCYDEALVS
jgi:hypothetical protein